MPIRITLYLCLVLLLGSACATAPRQPTGPVESFSLERDLVGDLIGHGSLSAIDGTHRRFVAYMNGSWDGQALTLIEDFEFDDGVNERKTWIFTKLANGEYAGRREDVVGIARGFQDGRAFRLEYKLRLPTDDGRPGRVLHFRDVLTLGRDGVIKNLANIGMFGFKVGSVALTIERT